MTTNEKESIASETAPQGVKPYRLIKLGVDVHWRQFVVVRQIDGSSPHPPQRFAPEQFVAWARKQTELAHDRTQYEALAWRKTKKWKIRLAHEVRTGSAASIGWISGELNLGSEASVRSLFCKLMR